MSRPHPHEVRPTNYPLHFILDVDEKAKECLAIRLHASEILAHQLARLAWEANLSVPPEWGMGKRKYIQSTDGKWHRILFKRYGQLAFIFKVNGYDSEGAPRATLTSVCGPFPRIFP